MIRKINKINNLGRFENFEGTSEFGKNTILFGFNGAGKSTLSDIFYSLTKDDTEEYLTRRRTLNREDESGEKNITIELTGENGQLYRFENDKWTSKPEKIYVFNEKYVEDHVFVSSQVEGDTAPIGIGTEGAGLMRKKSLLVHSNQELYREINEEISQLLEANIKIKDFTHPKINARTNILKRFEKIVGFNLYALADKEKIKEKLHNNERYSREIQIIENCREKYNRIKNVEKISVRLVLKKMKYIPRVSSKQIAEFLEKTLTTIDIKWAVRGYKNQKNKSICPMCGQSISDKQAIAFFDKLGKYVSQNKDDNLNEYSKELNVIATKLESLNIGEKIDIFVEIVNELNDNNLLLKRETNRLQKGLAWTLEKTEIINNLVKKTYEKAENPYMDISFLNEEDDAIKLLNAVINNIITLGDIIDCIQERSETKNQKTINREETGKIYELSYGAGGVYRGIAESIKSKASKYIKNNNKINALNVEINDCYNQSRLIQVNDFLLNLNTHLKIEVRDNQYYIKLKDFKAKKHEDKETITSEGENRAIAFAYFLAEVSNDENANDERIIVVDDPISSMDLSRKSIISHKISEMMNDDNCQMILMTHDIGFVERVKSYLSRKTTCELLEIRSGRKDFIGLSIEDYLTDDEKVYKTFINQAENNDNELDKIIAFMSLRPFAYVMKVTNEKFEKVMKKSTYFAHTLYSKNTRISFKKKDYDNKGLKSYVRLVSIATGSKFNVNEIVGDFSFEGFDFEKISDLYLSVPLDSMENMRKKVLLLRPLIEACFFQFSQKHKFDPEKISKMYNDTIKANKTDDEKMKMCLQLKEMYDASKKYHHGAEDGSLLGISWVNPNEVEYFDQIIQEIIEKIRSIGELRSLSA